MGVEFVKIILHRRSKGRTKFNINCSHDGMSYFDTELLMET